jgi:hypothetical protein
MRNAYKILSAHMKGRGPLEDNINIVREIVCDCVGWVHVCLTQGIGVP